MCPSTRLFWLGGVSPSVASKSACRSLGAPSASSVGAPPNELRPAERLVCASFSLGTERVELCAAAGAHEAVADVVAEARCYYDCDSDSDMVVVVAAVAAAPARPAS